MRELFVMDLKNYDPNGTVGRRPSVRGIIIRDGRIAMMHSCRYDYYKLPGGVLSRERVWRRPWSVRYRRKADWW